LGGVRIAVSNTSNYYGDEERVLENLEIVVARSEYVIIQQIKISIQLSEGHWQ
jgi:hypothetical protein